MDKGVSIERGYILDVAADGAYTVASYDRYGIETPPIKPIDSSTYAKGDMVYFFLFPDGTGKILCGE